MSTLTQSIVDGIRSGRLGGLTRAQQMEAMEAWEVLHGIEPATTRQPHREWLLAMAEQMVEHLKWAKGE